MIRMSPRSLLICRERKKKTKKTGLTSFTRTRFYSMGSLLANAVALREEVEQFRDELDKRAARKSSHIPEIPPGDIFRPLDEAYDGEPPPSKYDLDTSFDAAEALLPIMGTLRDRIAKIEGDDFGLLGLVWPALSHQKETILESSEERIRSLWPDLEAIVSPDQGLLIAQACLSRPSLPHETALELIDSSL